MGFSPLYGGVVESYRINNTVSDFSAEYSFGLLRVHWK